MKKYYLKIYWKSADVSIAVCEDCAKSTKNTIFNITKYLIETDISNDFSIDVIGQVVKQSESGHEQETQYLDDYLSGKLTDLQFIRKNKEGQEIGRASCRERV